MVNHINEYDSAMSSSKQGVQRARGGGYAYITETPILEYYNNQKPCNTMLVTKLFEVKSYGFGLPKNSEHTNALSVAILKVRLSSFGRHTTRCKVFPILPLEKFTLQYCDLDEQQTEMSFFAWSSVTRQFPKTSPVPSRFSKRFCGLRFVTLIPSMQFMAVRHDYIMITCAYYCQCSTSSTKYSKY